SLVSAATFASEVPTVRHVDVLSSGNHLEIEITTSAPVKPQTLVVTGPDRLIVDFPGAVPDTKLRNLTVNRGEVKSVRIGLFSQNPPTTRIVLDLKSAPQYQLFPSGRTIIVKLGESGPSDVPVATGSQSSSSRSSASQPVLRQVSLAGIGTVTGGTVTPLASAPVSVSTPVAAPLSAPPSDVRVEFKNGKLSIWADKATLASVLYEIQKRTGADISIPPSASQEKIVVDIAPAPAREALASLLEGSHFDFILLGSEQNPQLLRSVVITQRGQGVASNDAYYPAVQSAPPDSANDQSPPDTSQSDIQTTPEPQPDMVPQIPPDNSAQPPQNDQQQ
ncbi:MAG TPA: AMIN domain-containing protein, partial [Terriglobales bacterium]